MTSPLEGLSPAADSRTQIDPGMNAATGKDQFLKLLVAQISHQDPMNPLDDKDLVSQLAQFTQVEQAIETNQRLAALQGSNTTQGRTAMASLIGREVLADSSVIHWQHDQPSNVGFTLDAPAEHVNVKFLDGAGKLVRSWDVGALGPGNQRLPWDGLGDHRQAVADGDYAVQVTASDAQGKPVAARTQLHGTVSGVAFDPGGAAVVVGDIRLRPQDIVQINVPTAPPVGRQNF